MAKKETKKKKEGEKISLEEFEKKVKELAKSGLTSEKIGQKLKDVGIHPKEYPKKISEILGSSYSNPDLKNVEAKLNKIENHLKKNNQDKKAKREKDRVFSQLRKLKKYFGIPVN